MGPAEYLSALRSRWWTLAALVLVGTGVAWITTPSKASSAAPTTRFRATTVLVKGPSSTGDPTDATNLALTSSLVQSKVVIDRAAADVGSTPAELTTGLEAVANDKAGTLQVSVVGTDPAWATQAADAVAAQLLTFVAERRQQQIDPLIKATNDRITSLSDRVKTLDSQPPPPLGSPDLDLQKAERDSLVRQLSANYDRVQQLSAQEASVVNELAVLSPAVVAPESSSSGFSAPDSRGARAGLGLLVGLIAGLALVAAFERIDPKLRTTMQAEEAFGLPVVAKIPRQSRSRSRWRGGIVTFAEPHSVAAESYRGLRTALMYLPRADEAEGEVNDRFANGHVVLVTSPTPGDGKTTVVANLAAGFAERDDEVVVVSGDARQPAIERMLLGRRAAGARLASKEHTDAEVTMIPGVKLVLSCDPTHNPAGIVDYEREVARRARAQSQIVIIDTPPALVANDATELMQIADSVILVARCGATSVASARRSAEQLARLRVAIVGVVLVGTNANAVADSGYYRTRLGRRVRREHPRHDRLPSEIAGRRLPDLPRPTPAVAPPTLGDSRAAPMATRPLESFAPRPAAPVPAAIDDGGIWRPKPVIDLNGLDDRPPIRLPRMPVSEAPRAPRAVVGDGYPTRDALDQELPLSRGEGQGNGSGHGAPR